ncbi:MAG: hypothetical protein ABIJ96_04660 [Elusimicrobiota bacterium]
MALSADYRRELLRKLFHSLSLVYLAVYHLLGSSWFLWLLGSFIVIEGGLEAVRLRVPALNEKLMRMFGNIHRESEVNRISGIFWTSSGCFLTVVAYGAHPRCVAAGFLYLALGDGAAALAGKAWGRHPFVIGGRTKSVEGSLACLIVCLLAGWAAGLSFAGVAAGAVVATAIELLPVPIDDNFWSPLASAAAVSLF